MKRRKSGPETWVHYEVGPERKTACGDDISSRTAWTVLLSYITCPRCVKALADAGLIKRPNPLRIVHNAAAA